MSEAASTQKINNIYMVDAHLCSSFITTHVFLFFNDTCIFTMNISDFQIKAIKCVGFVITPLQKKINNI